jgi:hypothetical protein
MILRLGRGRKSRLASVTIAGLVVAASVSLAAVALAERGSPHRSTLVTKFVHSGPLSPYRPSVQARVVRGDALERAAAVRAIRAFGPANRILRIEFGAPPAAFNLPANAVWVHVDVSAPDYPGTAFSAWQGLLAVSEITDAARSSDSAPIAGKTITLVFPNGEVGDGGGTVNEPIPPATGNPAPASAQALQAGIAAEARQEHLKITEQGSFDIGGRPAVFATLVTSDPVTFGRETSRRMFALQQGVFNAPFSAAGSYIEVRDSAGGVVEIGASLSRLQQGLGWSNPALGRPGDLLAP